MLAARIGNIDAFVQQRLSTKAKTEGESIVTIRIPVVVHIVYNNNIQNISDDQVKSQIAALNRDFNRHNNDTLNTPERFRQLAARTGIEFYLATSDADGRPCTGIVRASTKSGYFGTDDKVKSAATGGDDAWPADMYLNIWVCSMRSLLGYSSVPGCDASKDGVVINYTAFGTVNAAAPYNLGRTAVHEIGHWLGLRHIWGDTYCGDDGVDDTPKQGNFTPGCPTNFRSSCSNGSTGDMYMNYMDYTDDACVNMFSEGQKSRMLALFADGGPRSAIQRSTGLNAPWKPALPPTESQPLTVIQSVRLYPNPANDFISFAVDADSKWIGKQVSIVSSNGVVVKAAMITAKTMRIDISSLRSGIYFLQADNGSEKFSGKIVKL